jgi:hypothetical protein
VELLSNDAYDIISCVLLGDGLGGFIYVVS